MEKIEYRVVIKFLFLKGNTPTKIKDELDSVYGDSAPLFSIVKFWLAEFKCGRESLVDDERLGRPNTASTDNNIAKFHQMVLDNHRIKVRESILNQDLGMRKLSARWVSRLLTLDQIRVR
ncbi:unnamed protein product [Parnassius mnemosyne]|uniref:Mos1 transposase HTH domain-containing protein n=1 Tax=Parnassius mnemosyne TaxID=213953 RepID=A0AAV1KR99_9NEOP